MSQALYRKWRPARWEEPMRLIVGISGASGVIYGIRLLEVLKGLGGVETHLVMSRYARLNIEIETTYTPQDVEAQADVVHSFGNQAAAISSGSFRTDGMVIAPCSMKTLSGVVNSYADNLVVRAADVTLIAVSKVQPLERIEAVLAAGHRVFGENRVQEAQGKWPAFRERFEGVELHLIGPLQTNKARAAMELFDVIQSIRLRKGTHDNMMLPGLGAGVVRVHGTSKLLAFTADVTPRYVLADPVEGGAFAVAGGASLPKAPGGKTMTGTPAARLAASRRARRLGVRSKPEREENTASARGAWRKACRAAR